MSIDELRPLGLFDGLSETQLAELVAGGTEVAIEPGVDLFQDGDHADFWWVLIDGAIDLVRFVGREYVVVGRMDVPGRWAGGFRAWDEDGVYLATGRGVTAGRVFRLPAAVLRQLSFAWFPFGGRLIEGLYRTARTIESTVRQRESLVTLGTLAAGLAHEINNPSAAAARAVDGLADAIQTLVSTVGQLARNEVTAAQFAALDELRRDIETPTEVLDPVEVADRQEALSSWLTRRGVDRGWAIAPALAAAGVDVEWSVRAEAVLDATYLRPGLEYVASTLTVATLLSEMREATRRVTQLVGAVRSYSQMDRASTQLINVTDGLDSTLTILGHMIGQGVTVVRDYGSGTPAVYANAGELNQVWTNLIHNAVDAMDGAGTLRVTTRADGDAVVVEIGDDGPGMPPQVAARAFEAFYSTKDVGKGTGLGLDIARRIVVERHGGTITIDSRPGDTVLMVRLPVRDRQTS